ncbi:MAG: hypothetical protein ABI794_05075 [Betaproteobacteria bacterium]
MKRTDLEKHKALKIVARMQQDSPAMRASALPGSDRREQRKRDQALGLVPFAVKLDSGLIKELQMLAATRNVPMSELVGELLRKGLGAPAGA